MDTPLTPQDPNKNPIDLGKILLPKKEEPGHTVDSAQRVNAGALLEQEITAGSLGTDTQQAHAADISAAIKPEPAPKAEDDAVKPLETFQRDIESVVEQDNVSVLTIATAEANRRAGSALPNDPDAKQNTAALMRNIALIAGGVILLVGASGVLAYLVTRTEPLPAVSSGTTPASPFIQVDTVKDITITPDETRSQVMSDLNAAREATSLQVGLMAQLLVTESSSTPNGEVLSAIPAQDFFTFLTPNIPPALARSFEPAYLLGVHEYNGEQPFLIFKVDSYEDAYAGMLAWEPYMQQDLAPLFTYTPTAHIPEEGIATTSSDSTDQFIQTGFVDDIVENHDARVLENNTGDIYLLWTFLDSNTLVITTNDATLREIISRLTEAPITPIPNDQ